MYIASYSYGCINTQNTNMHIAMPNYNRNYTTVCTYIKSNIVICSLLFREHYTIISAPCIAADTCGFFYHNSPIKVVPHLLPCTKCRGIVGGLIFLKGDFLTVG